MTLTRIWGNHIALIYQDALPGPDGLITYGFTAQFGQRVANRIPKPETGLRGSEMVRVGEFVRELVVAGDMGYFIQNAAADSPPCMAAISADRKTAYYKCNITPRPKSSERFSKIPSSLVYLGISQKLQICPISYAGKQVLEMICHFSMWRK